MDAEFALPALGENIETIQVARVLVNAGDTVSADQPVLELETDKATIELPSPRSGTVARVFVREGDEIKVGHVLLAFADGEAPTAIAKEPATTPASAPHTPVAVTPARPSPAPESAAPRIETSRSVPAAPSVRRFAREIGIDITRVSGTGPDGRISRDDVQLAARQQNAAPAPEAAATADAGLPPLPDFEKWGPVERRKMTVIRRKTAEHLALSWSQIPHVTIVDKADITELDALRQRYADRAVKAGGKLTMAVMVCKVAAVALKRFAKFNASIDMAAGQIVYKNYIHLGVAVNTDRGLVVPVIRNADQKNMIQLAVDISHLAEKARQNSLSLAEMEGGTFTVTNLGRIAGLFFTPIVNYPEVAILGIGRAGREPAADDRPARMMLPLSLSFDHRIIDGAEGAAFLAWLIEAIEQPLVLSLEG